MNNQTEQELQYEIGELIRKRLDPRQSKDAEDIICIIKDIIKILNTEYPNEDVKGFVFEWTQKTEKFYLRTYPSKVFPEIFSFERGEENKLVNKMLGTTCATEELSEICCFFRDNKHTKLVPLEKENEKEVYRIEFI